MAHEVALDINTKFILHKDVVVEVKKDNETLGKLLISKGNVEWLPANNSVNKFRLSWSKFADLMKSEGRQVKIKSNGAKSGSKLA